MGENNRAICPCTENELVVALREDKNVFSNWGFGTAFLTILLGLLTGGFWFVLVGGWLIGKYFTLKPGWRCNRCGAVIESYQLR